MRNFTYCPRRGSALSVRGLAQLQSDGSCASLILQPRRIVKCLEQKLQDLKSGEVRVRKVLILPAAVMILLASGLLWAINVTGLTATPSTITFTGNNPGGTVTGNQTATVAFSITSSTHNNWTLSVGTGATSFTGCTYIPVSAVTVSCSTATATPAGSGAGASCSASGSLPSTIPGLAVATGKEPNDGSTKNYNIVVSYQLADSWKYIPNTCPLTITYTANAQ
jgi:hypothetical protein